MYGYALEKELSPGDIIRAVRLVERITGEEAEMVSTSPVNVIVLTQGCEIDKVARHDRPGGLCVAGVFQLDRLDKGQQGNVRQNKINSLFYLPSYEERMPECYIDWRTLQHVELMPIWSGRNSERYVCHVIQDSELWKSLAHRCWEFFFRPLPREVASLIAI